MLDAVPAGLDGEGRRVASTTDPDERPCEEVVVFTRPTAPQPAGLYLGGRLHRRIG